MTLDQYVSRFLGGLIAASSLLIPTCTVGCTNPNQSAAQNTSQKEQLQSQLDAIKQLGVKGYFYGKVEDPNVYTKTEFGISGAEVVVIGELTPAEPGTEPVVGPVRQPVDESPGKVHYPPTIPTEVIPTGGQ